jgi:hypothetical protein
LRARKRVAREQEPSGDSVDASADFGGRGEGARVEEQSATNAQQGATEAAPSPGIHSPPKWSDRDMAAVRAQVRFMVDDEGEDVE